MNHKKKQILDLVKEYYHEIFEYNSDFIPGVTSIPYSGRVFDYNEMVNLIESGLEFWLTGGRFQKEFEDKLSHYLDAKNAILVNSGSSANLLALSALTSEKLRDRRLKPGDEVITVASGFTTTVNPIIQNRLVPVFCDVEIGSYNIDVDSLKRAFSSKTRAIMVAHTLGNPVNIDILMELKDLHDLWIVEDNCDGLGSLWEGQKTGNFGDLSTLSFYPSHHITMGEGGAVVTNKGMLKKIVESFRDWGRDCWCLPGKSNTCLKRYDWKLGDLPKAYDHKYIYSHIGYNMKATEMQASIGVAQLDKVEGFIQKRRDNFQFFFDYFSDKEKFFILPKWHKKAQPSWFGFPLTLNEKAPFKRAEIVTFLEEKKIATRMLMGGNLIRQPAYKSIEFRTVDDLKSSDYIMNHTFWFGVYPGLSEIMKAYMIDCFDEFFSAYK